MRSSPGKPVCLGGWSRRSHVPTRMLAHARWGPGGDCSARGAILGGPVPPLFRTVSCCLLLSAADWGEGLLIHRHCSRRDICYNFQDDPGLNRPPASGCKSKQHSSLFDLILFISFVTIGSILNPNSTYVTLTYNSCICIHYIMG